RRRDKGDIVILMRRKHGFHSHHFWVAKNPRVTSKQHFLVLANESTIRRTLNTHGVHGRVSRRKPLLYKKTIAARLQLAKDHVDKPDELFDLNEKCNVWRKEHTAFQHKYLIPSVKHGGGIMVWAGFAASGPGWLAIIDGTMNSVLHQLILKENVRTSVQELSLKRKWAMQQRPQAHKSFYQSMVLKQAVYRRNPTNITYSGSVLKPLYMTDQHK
uniref:Transposase Tc1-like domain-containing protein n=1 Tax=Sinocyclocheilus anshuiensis TaxID=1608454 RepID=A0A671SG18_9TELE